jgi:hypothetical protein
MLHLIRLIRLLLYDLKLKYDVITKISSIQAKTFSIIVQLNGNLDGKRRYNINNIVDNIMLLQELSLTDDDLDFYKSSKIRIITNYIIDQNRYFDLIGMSYQNGEHIKNIMYTLSSNDDYFNELEVLNLIKKEKECKNKNKK